jgi:phage terminase large subunit-like protein
VPYDQTAADAACNFFELVLKHTADSWYGKPFKLAPWQEKALCSIFGTVDEDGRRVIELVYLEIPKKAGKTEFTAGVILLCLALDKNPGCQVYGAGAALRQAANVYRAACKMVEQSPLLKRRLRLLRSTHRIVKRSDPDSFYAAVAADGDLSDGVNPAVVVADEVHRWRTRKQLDNWDVLSLGGITRQQTLTIAITTAGVQSESPLAWRLHEKTRRIDQKVIEDPTFYGAIYGADDTDDWTDEKTWIKANPSLIENGGFLPIEKIRQKFVAAQSDPEAEFSFKRYYLNIWGEKESRALKMAEWDACGKKPNEGTIQWLPWRASGMLPRVEGAKVRELPTEIVKHFEGRQCWAGLDMSMTTDMSAATFVFPCPDGGFEWLPFIWLPERDIRSRQLRDGVPYQLWAKQGFLELCGAFNGAFIDQAEIEERIRWGKDHFDLREVCYDPWNAHALAGRLMDSGIECVEIRQGFATLSAPSKKFLELVTAGKLYHGDHPVLKWNASCLVKRETNDNLMFTKPERGKSHLRIDGITAGVNAMRRAMLDEQGPQFQVMFVG